MDRSRSEMRLSRPKFFFKNNITPFTIENTDKDWENETSQLDSAIQNTTHINLSQRLNDTGQNFNAEDHLKVENMSRVTAINSRSQ